MRIRTEDALTDLTINRVYNSNYTQNCVDIVQDVVNEKLYGQTRVTKDVEIENFHARRAKGELFFNPFSSTYESRTFASGGWHYTRDTPTYHCYMDKGNGPIWVHMKLGLKSTPSTPYNKVYIAGHLPSNLDLEVLKTLAMTQALANVKKPEFAALVSLGELRETIGYLRNPLKRLTKLLRKNREQIKVHYRNERGRHRFAKVRKKTTGKDAYEVISDSYLGGRYGLRPLISEVQGYLKAIEALKDKTRRFTARGYTKTQEEMTEESILSGRTMCWDWNIPLTTVHTAECRAGSLYDVNLKDSFGFDLSQVPVALWELTFLSFMADWFVNMGNYIAAITPKSGIDIRGEWVVVRQTKDSYADFDATYRPTWSGTVQEIINPSGSEHLFTRTITRGTKLRAGVANRSHTFEHQFDLGTGKVADMFLIASKLLT